MSQVDFERDWVPRVGEPAARRLARRDNLLLLIPLMCLGVAVALASLNGVQATSSLMFAVATLVVSVIVLLIWLRSRVLLAREISQWLGVKVTWVQLPRMQPSSFDKWCRRRGIAPRDQQQKPDPTPESDHAEEPDDEPDALGETDADASVDTHSGAVEPTASESA